MRASDSPVNDLDTVVPVTIVSVLDWIALAMLIMGGLNWGLVGVMNFDLVAAIFGNGSFASHVVYTLVGLAALYCIYFALRLSRPRR